MQRIEGIYYWGEPLARLNNLTSIGYVAKLKVLAESMVRNAVETKGSESLCLLRKRTKGILQLSGTRWYAIRL